MTAGRCAGCGVMDNSCKKIKSHVLTCPDYLEVFKSDPAKALPPEEEWVRWQNEDNSDEARAVAKEIRLTKRFAEMDAKREAQSERWQKPKDILDD